MAGGRLGRVGRWRTCPQAKAHSVFMDMMSSDSTQVKSKRSSFTRETRKRDIQGHAFHHPTAHGLKGEKPRQRPQERPQCLGPSAGAQPAQFLGGGGCSSASSTLTGNLNPPASRHLAAANTHADNSGIWVPEELHRIMSRSTSRCSKTRGLPLMRGRVFRVLF